jgi:hypothetical protein
MTIIEQLVAIKEDGKNVKQARGFLAFEHTIEGKEATELLKEAGFTVGVKGGGLTDTIAFLESEPRTEFDLYEHILETGTKNEARWIAQRNSIRMLSVNIYKKLGEDFDEVRATDQQKAAITAKVKAA